MALKQPIGQKRLTNIAVVRYKKHGKRFEIACFKNQAIAWRNRVEKDIDEVLQTRTVFSNVSKGVLAKSKELIEAFGTDDQDKICLEILEKGELQISDKEREAKYSSQFRDVANIVMEKTVNPETQRPYTIGMIERFMREVHFAMDLNHSAKQQALDVIKLLEKRFPIARARMKLALTTSDRDYGKVVDRLMFWGASIDKEEKAGGQCTWVFQIDPGTFRACDAFCKECNGRLGVVSMAVQKEGAAGVDVFEDFPERKTAAEASPRTRLQGDMAPGAAAGASVAFLSAEDTLMSNQSTSGSRERVEQSDAIFQSSGGEGEARVGLEALQLSGQSSSPVSQERKGGGTSSGGVGRGGGGRQVKCSTCSVHFGSAAEYRDHCKAEWHRHNLKRKLKGLLPLTAEECETDTDIVDEKNDLDEYCR